GGGADPYPRWLGAGVASVSGRSLSKGRRLAHQTGRASTQRSASDRDRPGRRDLSNEWLDGQDPRQDRAMGGRGLRFALGKDSRGTDRSGVGQGWAVEGELGPHVARSSGDLRGGRPGTLQ